MKKDDAEYNLNEFETLRLRLRKLALADADQLLLLRSDKRVNRYLDRPTTTSYNEAVQFINKILEVHAYYWAITFKDDVKLIGTICLSNLDYENSTVEIGYELFPEFQCKGIMAEALSTIITFNSDQLFFKTIIGTTHKENISSISLLEKNGFKRDHLLEEQIHAHGNPINETVYSRTS